MSRSGPVGVGLIGAGMISDTYLENLTSFPDIRVLVVGDLDQARARAQAEKYAIPESGNSEDVLSHPEVELVVNLTIPAVHAQVSSQAIAAGKHVWSEKPISVDRDSGRALLESATARACSSASLPTRCSARASRPLGRAIARGDIGEPLSAQTVMQYPGPDIFHPNPEFLFAKGAGPLFDIGPYYLTTLVHIFGPVTKVAAVGSRSRPTRTVQVGDRKGTAFPVEVPTHVSAIAQFASGGVSQSVFSFESPLARMGVVEVTGTEGTLVVPDPNQFTGDVKITRAQTFEAIRQEAQWETVPLTGALAGRGTGVLDLARCIRSGSPPLASGALGFHILDTMLAIEEAVTTGHTVDIRSTVDPVPLVADDWDPFAATL